MLQVAVGCVEFVLSLFLWPLGRDVVGSAVVAL